MKKLIIAFALISAASVSHAKTVCFDTGGILAKMEFNEQFVRVNWNLEEGSFENFETGDVTRYSKQGSVVSFHAFYNGRGDAYDQRITVGNTQVSFQTLWSNGKPSGDPTIFQRAYCK